jgi:hypothetical protein
MRVQPRRRRWTRTAGILAGTAVLAVVAAWAVVSIADSITAIAAAQPGEQIVGTGGSAPSPAASIGAALSGSGLAAPGTNAWGTSAPPALLVVLLVVVAALAGAGRRIQRRHTLTV